MSLGEEVTKAWNVAKPRNPLDLIAYSLLNQATQKVYLPFLQAEVILDNALAKSRLTHAPHGNGGTKGRNLNLGMNCNLSRGEQVRGHLQIHTHILELKLCAGKQANASR